MLEVGEILGGHHVLRRLGAGGMATLYLGASPRPDGYEHVALKVVHAHLCRVREFIAMFTDEARLAKRIRHPNVVRVDALEQDGDLSYLVMEYVKGRSAAELMDTLVRRRRRIPVQNAVAIARRAAMGLHAAHEVADEAGNPLCLVHRDVSPGNILVSDDGRVKLIDFGIAKARGRTYQTRTGHVRGKLRYLAPEQARGLRIDRRADVYSLGVVLWEMLTLKRYALGQSEVSVLMRVQRPSPRRASKWRRDLPTALEAVLDRALHPDADRRFSSALAFADALVAAVPAASNVGRPELAAMALGLYEKPPWPLSAPRVRTARRPKRLRASAPPRPLASLRPHASDEG